jgi:uncharacterized protein
MDKSVNTLMVVFTAGIILIAVILVLNGGQTKVVMGQEQNAITVSGNARLEVEPDQAEIFVNVETTSDTARRAKDDNARTVEQVIKALKQQGVRDDDIETVSFYLSPRYRYDPKNGESTLEGYTLSNVLKVTTRDVDNAGIIIDAAVNNGANSIQNVRFGLSDNLQKEVFGQALVRASEVAGEKAQSLTASLSVNLGKVISIQESNFNFVPFDYAPRIEAFDEAAKVATQIEPGKVEIGAFVSISYELR